MNLWIRVLLAMAISWVCSASLGLLLAVALSDNYSPKTLLLPGVIPVALIGSTIVAIAMTPLAIWSLRAGARNLWFYGPILWIVLAGYVLFVIPRGGHYGPYGLLGLAAVGLVVLGFVPAK